MIKIHDKLWYVVKQDSKDKLSYMTHYKDDSSFEKRKNTGLKWSKTYVLDTNDNAKSKFIFGVEGECDNTPQKGFFIGDSVSRWSTSNKLFRVTDPRGFMVEVPTGNISTLLKLTDVSKGIIQEECVWGRDGSNHILLPVNSEPYLEAKKNMEVLSSPTIKISDVPYGSVVKLLNDDQEYTFLGRGKPVFKVTPYSVTNGWHFKYTKNYGEPFEYTNKTYTNIFRCAYSYKDSFYYNTLTSPKISEIVKEGFGKEWAGDMPALRSPRSVSDEVSFRKWCGHESEVVDVLWKKVK